MATLEGRKSLVSDGFKQGLSSGVLRNQRGFLRLEASFPHLGSAGTVGV